MQPFFQSKNLKDKVLEEGFPWDFAPANLEEVRAMKKDQRKNQMREGNIQWNVYSAVRATAFNERVSKENPPRGLRGLVADYDMKMSVAEVEKYLSQISPIFVPNFIEISLSKRIRLVWVFEREILLPNSRFCGHVISEFFDRIGTRTLLAGYDHKSEDPCMVWTNGGEWHDVNPKPMPWETMFGVIAQASKKTEFGKADIPLEIVWAKVKDTFPGRWQGEFKLNATGVRFWDEKADNPAGCQVKPDGMLCFTGNAPFMKWEQIFGASWANEQRTTNLGKIAADIYYDGSNYWEFRNDKWYPTDRCDILLRLKVRGVSNAMKPGTGDTSSDAENVMDYIQITNRVDGAAPVICQQAGLVRQNGKVVLNISTVKALAPHPEPATTDQFPWIWKFLSGLFDQPEEKPLDFFLAWLQRIYVSLYTYRCTMGQAVFLCGPRENGKSLLCFKIIKPLLGDMIANPYEYFIGMTTFNSELFESPLLAINDEQAPGTEQEKQKFLFRIKTFVVNPSHKYHAKFCKPVEVEWTGRLFMTLNDDAESVGLLPEVTKNTRDKLMFFASRPYTDVWEPSHILEPRIEEELPFFARWLLDWTPPAEVLEPGRVGVKSYFDQRILNLSRQQTPSYNLLETMAIWVRDSGLWAEGVETIDMTPADLNSALSECETARANMKDMNQNKVSRALRTLSQLSDTGVEIAPETNERKYRFTRTLIAKAGK